jgi:hypothetical protein
VALSFLCCGLLIGCAGMWCTHLSPEAGNLARCLTYLHAVLKGRGARQLLLLVLLGCCSLDVTAEFPDVVMFLIRARGLCICDSRPSPRHRLLALLRYSSRLKV